MKSKISFLMNMLLNNLKPFLTIDNLVLAFAVFVILLLSVIIFFKRDTYTWRKNAPSLITTSGIFCTFVGVSMGLTRFNLDDDNSLKYLLAGLKIAFIPSALAIFIAIIFKWMSSKQSSQNLGLKFIDKLAENTAAIDRLVTAVTVVDWQVAYKENLEVNIDKNARLLAILETSLSELLQYLRDKPDHLYNAVNGLENSINEINLILKKVNGNLSTEINAVTSTFKAELEENYKVSKNEVQKLFQEVNRLNQTLQQLGGDASDVCRELENALTNVIRSIESQVSQKLTTVLSEVSQKPTAQLPLEL